MNDTEVLQRFVWANDPDAFRVLIDRHGPMVLAVCRTVLREQHDAEDAFQSTFLVLARRAGTIKRRDSIAPWLHRVAHSRCEAGAAPGVSKASRRTHTIGGGSGDDVPASRSFVHSVGPRRGKSPAGAVPSAREALLLGWKNQRGGCIAIAMPCRDGEGPAFEGPTNTSGPPAPPWPGSLPRAAGGDFLTIAGIPEVPPCRPKP